jgi:hypothetical protein
MVYNKTMSNSNSHPFKLGADPVNLQWKVVRGDTAKIRIEFYQTDGTTYYDTSSWSYASTAYDSKTDTFYTLTTTAGSGFVDITAPSATTDGWGSGQKAIAGELSFDLQVIINSQPWTPVIGTIVVVSDVTLNG